MAFLCGVSVRPVEVVLGALIAALLTAASASEDFVLFALYTAAFFPHKLSAAVASLVDWIVRQTKRRKKLHHAMDYELDARRVSARLRLY